jgi:nucleoside-diphosphate-sugar epimerase
METYGHHEAPAPFTEGTPQYPMAPYAVAKVAAEKYLHYMQYAYNFPFTILRQTNTYGRVENEFFIMERIIGQALDGGVINLGEPDPIRNFLYISDLIDLYMKVLEKRPLGSTFVTGPNNGLTIRELVEKVTNIMEWRGQVNWHTIPKRPGEIFYLNSDEYKARILLGWQPKIGLDEGIRKTVEGLRRKRIEAA